MDTLNVENTEELKADFRSVSECFHRIRQKRNKLLHSAFIELNSFDKSYGIVRIDPRLETDPDTGEILFDTELLTLDELNAAIREMGELAIRVNKHYIQLLRYMPYSNGF